MRTIAKTTTYGFMHLSVAIAVAYALSGNWKLALTIGLVEPLVQTVAYTLHESLWSQRAKPVPVAAVTRKAIKVDSVRG